MSFPKPPKSRYLWSAHLARLAAAGALTLVPLACGGNSDAGVFESASTPSPTTAKAAAATATTALTTMAVPTTIKASVTTAAPASAAAARQTFPSGGELVVNFSFAPTAGGRVRNPYVVVWVEDSSGKLVKTVSLWFERSGKGTRWLSDLRSWAAASGRVVDQTTSGSTRTAGAYSVAWNGLGDDGAPVPAGQYTVFVEAARENGPYEVTSSPITIGPKGFTVTIPSDGELNALSATLKA